MALQFQGLTVFQEPAGAEGHDEAEAVEMDADETYEAEAEGWGR